VAASLLDSPVVGLVGIDAAGHVAWCNGVASRLLGLALQRLPGEPTSSEATLGAGVSVLASLPRSLRHRGRPTRRSRCATATAASSSGPSRNAAETSRRQPGSCACRAASSTGACAARRRLLAGIERRGCSRSEQLRRREYPTFQNMHPRADHSVRNGVPGRHSQTGDEPWFIEFTPFQRDRRRAPIRCWSAWSTPSSRGA
jgi:hypothetical protein